jgi:hypothetical protein
MQNISSIPRLARILKKHPSPEKTWTNQVEVRRYGYSCLQSLCAEQDWEYVSRLTFSVRIDFSGLPAHHHAVVFEGQDIPDLIRVVPSLIGLQTAPDKRNSSVSPRSRRRKTNTLRSTADRSASSSPIPPSTPPTTASPVSPPAKQQRPQPIAAAQSAVASAAAMLALPKTDFTVVASGPPASAKPSAPPVTTANRFVALADDSVADRESKDVPTDEIIVTPIAPKNWQAPQPDVCACNSRGDFHCTACNSILGEDKCPHYSSPLVCSVCHDEFEF